MSVLIFVSLYFVQLWTRTLGAPTVVWEPLIQNLTALRTDFGPPWVPEPRTRGTWAILYSCTFTIFLCVYTAIHMNVPRHGCGRVEVFLQRGKWVLVTLVSPEVALYSALSQWYEAYVLYNFLNGEGEKLRGSSDDSRSTPVVQLEPNKVPRYTLQHGFYMVMGGVVCRFSNNQDKEERRTLTPDIIKALAAEEVFIVIDPDDIGNKSKASLLAKGLVCFQVSWVALEAIVRKISGYPLTLLEIHTLVHVFCALVMYILWLKKPTDVHDPTLIGVDELGFTIPEARNYPPRALNLKYTSDRTLLALPLFSAAYGGVHLAAWNFVYPTAVEQVLWKCCCIITLCGCLVVYGWIRFPNGVTLPDRVGKLRRPLQWLLYVLALAVSFVVLAARIAIVIESFISIRKVPSGVYATVPWVEHIPHL